MQDTRASKTTGKRISTVVAANSKNQKKQTQYKVKQGDSLYVVAKRFNVEMQHLKRWNPRMGKALKPGQMLTVYSPQSVHAPVSSNPRRFGTPPFSCRYKLLLYRP